MATLEKTFDILEAIAKHGGEVSLADLANMTGLNRSTAHRISSMLVKRGYLYQKHKGGKYSLGLKVLQLNGIANVTINIKDQAFPFLKKLSDEISETVVLAVLDGVDAVSIATVGPEHLLRIVPSIAKRFPLRCTSVGKILLAYMPDENIENIIDVLGLDAYTYKTITDRDQMRKEIEKIRHKGVAFDDEEYTVGIRGASAPIKVENGNVIAAVSFVAPSPRISISKMRQLAPKLRRCALEISHAMGYKGE